MVLFYSVSPSLFHSGVICLIYDLKTVTGGGAALEAPIACVVVAVFMILSTSK